MAKPNQSMISNARKGLELRRKFNRGGTQIGVSRARDIINNRDLSDSTIKRMWSYFRRHEVDKQADGWGSEGNPSAGYIAWLLWGGDAGYNWARARMRDMGELDESMQPKTSIFVEQLDLTEAVIDRETRTVKQVIIRAGESKNKRMYGENVLREAAPLFEGVQTYANHPSRTERRDRPERSVNQLTGWISDVHFAEGKLIGTRHFTKNQAGSDTWALVQDIVEGNAPATLLGASINATGKARTVDGTLIVEAITGVVSVDDVTMPAAGGGFVESASGDDLLEQVLTDMSYEEWFESRPDYRKRLQKEMKAVRQEDAVKAAEAEAGRIQEALTETTQALQDLKEAHEAAQEELTRVRRELAIVEMLGKVKLPARWKSDLRTRLIEADTAAWDGIVESELEKARTAGAVPRVPVHGAGQQVSAPVQQKSLKESLLPRPNEDVDAWRKRTSK